MKTITIKRVYDNKTADGSYRILVDRLWPRGVRKIDLQIDEWDKEITPSPELRKWFDHKEERFEEFSKLYIQELMAKTDEINRVRSIAKNEDVTLLYGAKDPEINHAIILQHYLLK
ncbi:DUF488 family protein [Flavobacterium plurextorum]|uniref:DUF488 domain-containing protein n=1 Tax=Flavobacterium TaxID=237 RepID=UPI00214D521B|nr:MULTISPECIES: DUF488 family protein [Flavobacterium]UUW08452.1 DUF488 family protein [Flavobacterium plurextorum]